MIKHFEIYDPTKTYVYPGGAEATPENIQMTFSMVNLGTCVVETDVTGRKFYAVEFLAEARENHGIDAALSDSDAIAALEQIVNTPAPDPGPTAEERIAAQLELQNLMAM